MATIPTMTGEPTPAAGTETPPAAEAPAGALPADTKTPPASGPPAATAAAAVGRAARTLAVPIPTAIVAALVTGMFGMLFFSLNGLRSDIDTLRTDTNSQIDSLRTELFGEIGSVRGEIDSLRSDMNSQIDGLRTELFGEIGSVRGEIGSVRGEIGSLRSDMNQRFAEVHSVLLDHTDRLARIETHLDIGPPAEADASEPGTAS